MKKSSPVIFLETAKYKPTYIRIRDYVSNSTLKLDAG